MLNAVVTDLNTVPETFRSAYKEQNGKFHLQVTPVEGFALENVTGLKNALDGERAAKEQAERKAKVFDGIDPDAARTALASATLYGDITPDAAKHAVAEVARLTAIDPAKEADKIADEKVKRAKGTMEATFAAKEGEFKTQIEAVQSVNEGLKGQLRTLLVGNQIKSEIARLKVVEGLETAAELLAERSIKTVEKDGKFEVQVVDGAGNVRHKLDGTTLVPFTVADLMAEIKQNTPGLFQADNKGGIGIVPGNGVPKGNGQENPWAKGQENRTKQAVLTKTNPTLAAQLKLQAGVA